MPDPWDFGVPVTEPDPWDFGTPVEPQAPLPAPIPTMEPPVGFDPEGSGYDDATAATAGLRRDERGHMGSLDPRTGMVLKSHL